MDSWLTVETVLSVQPVTASHHYPRHFVFERGALKHEIQIVQHLFVGGQFHIDDMTITSDEKPVCLVAAAVRPSFIFGCSFAARTGNTQVVVNWGTTGTRLKAY